MSPVARLQVGGFHWALIANRGVPFRSTHGLFLTSRYACDFDLPIDFADFERNYEVNFTYKQLKSLKMFQVKMGSMFAIWSDLPCQDPEFFSSMVWHLS